MTPLLDSSSNKSRPSIATSTPRSESNHLPLKKRSDHQLTPPLHDSQKARSKKQIISGNADHGNNQEHPPAQQKGAKLASTNDSYCIKRKRSRPIPITITKPATKKRKQTRTNSTITTTATTTTTRTKQKEQSSLRSGRWSFDEHKAFLRGLKEHGKGKWSKIAKEIPTR